MKKKINIEIGRRLKHVRESLKMSQFQIALRLYTTQSMYQKYESGESPISIRVAANCTLELDVSLYWLITGKGDVFMNRSDELRTRIETTYFKEAGELLYYMEKNPLIRHSVLAHFQKLKKEQGVLVDE